MNLSYTYWKDDGWFVGYLDDYPDYTTQGETLAAFEEMLRSLYADIQTQDIPFVRRASPLTHHRLRPFVS